MKRIFIILALLSFLVSAFSGNIVDSPPVSAQEKEHSAKINSLLSLQVESKLRALEATPTARGQAELSQVMPQQVDLAAPQDRQQIFIHSEEMPNQSQVEELESMGLKVYPESWIPPVGSHPTGFIVADMPIDKLDELAAKDYVATLDTAERYFEAHNDLGAQKINADDVWSANYTGANVTIAVLDSGLDTTHNDIPTPVASKDYSNYPTLDDTIANQVTGHGTHVAGTALGRGTQSSEVYKGSAPGASLVFLKIGNDTTGQASTTAIVNAMKAAVDTYNADIITMSYGGWSSYQDGSDQMAQAVDYAVSQGAVVFISAGNEGNDGHHYSGTVSANSSTGYIQMNIVGAGISDTALQFTLVWYDGTGTSNDLELEYYDTSYNLLASTNGPQSESSRGTESETSSYDYWLPPGSGTYYLKVKNNSSNSQSYHIYYDMGVGRVKFNNPDPDYTITSPADADSAIAVGAYTTRKYWWDYANNGWQWTNETVDQISTFSSRGPRVDTGAPNKPNFVAPGCGIISCRDNDVYPWASKGPFYIDNDGPNTNNATNNDGSGPADYYMDLGTSMACPMAAGVAALILEKYPSMTPTQVKTTMESTATDKGAPGFDNTYGYGLIDALATINYDFTLPTMETIAEAQGQYHNTDPILSNFGFYDETALDDGWYQMDSYSGSWVSLFTDDSDTSWDSDNWTIPGFAGLSEGSHTIYFKASDDTANVEGESGEWSWQFYKDTVAPTDPTGVSSTSHTVSDWSSDNTVDVTWTDATDNTSGLDGYSILWNTSNSTVPDAVKDVEEGSGSTTSAALVDGSSHYFHIRSVDNAGNWQSTVHLGPFFIETVPPTDPTSVNSTSHITSVWSSDNTVDITWTDATDVTSELDGYSILWNTSNSTVPDATKDIEEGSENTTSSELASGNSHYFHIRSVDNAGNWQSTVHLGPFYIDTTPPTDPTSVSSTSHSTSTWSSDNTVDVTWTDATDNLSELDGYSVLWDTSPTTIPNQTKNVEEGVQNATSTALADGNSHYFHITSVDNAGNWQSTVHLGPFYIAVNAPYLSSGSVSPNSGYTSATYIFSVNYTDFENEAPISITISIDSGTSENMTIKSGQDGDLTNGEIYEYSISGASLGTGSHTFQFAANDGTDDAIGDVGSHSGPTISSPPPPPGGGGGGGGGGGATDDTRITSFGDAIAENGLLFDNIEAFSLDNNLRLDIPKGTTAVNRNNIYIIGLRIKTLAEPPEVPENMESVGSVYELLPEGAKFDPPISLTIEYDTSNITEGISVSSLYIAKWDESNEEWIELESTVDPTVQTVSTEISGFSIHTVLASAVLAQYTLTDLNIKPEIIEVGDSIDISVILANPRNLTGSYEVNLMIDDVLEQVQEVTLDSGESESVIFTITPDIVGEHIVNIGGLLGTYTVEKPKLPAAFKVSDLAISPVELLMGGRVTINVILTNTGGRSGIHNVSLIIDGVQIEIKSTELDVGESRKVVFTIIPHMAGAYSVDIEGLSGSFVVEEMAPIPAQEEELIIPASTAAPTLEPSTTPEQLPKPLINLWTIAGIIFGIAIVGLASYYFIRKKRKLV